MIKKRKLLFIIDSLGTGGAERSLINLLSILDSSKYEIDLQLLNMEGKLTSQIPEFVNLLELPEVIDELNKPTTKLIKKPLLLISKAIYSISVKYLKLSNAGKASLFWLLFGKYFERKNCRYDIVVGYSQGIPTFYAIDKVEAQKKIVWVNVDYNISGWVKRHQKKYYDKAHVIVTVSQPVYQMFSSEIFPEFKNKIMVIRDLISPEFIRKMALKSTNITLKKDLPMIMTVGRLNKPQKGYDIAIEAAKILMNRGVKFVWYAVGEGPYHAEMEQIIKSYGLEDNFILLGETDNPYNLMNKCDIYVQPSRHEGYGLTLAEAMILGKPAVATSFNTVHLHIEDGENGFITSFNPEEIADKINLLMSDNDLRKQFEDKLDEDRFAHSEDIDKLIRMIEN